MEPAGSGQGQKSPELNTDGPESQDTASRTEDTIPRPETEPGSVASPGPGTTARGLLKARGDTQGAGARLLRPDPSSRQTLLGDPQSEGVVQGEGLCLGRSGTWAHRGQGRTWTSQA
eukprot:61255-Rhodomonas_salina.1